MLAPTISNEAAREMTICWFPMKEFEFFEKKL